MLCLFFNETTNFSGRNVVPNEKISIKKSELDPKLILIMRFELASGDYRFKIRSLSFRKMNIICSKSSFSVASNWRLEQ